MAATHADPNIHLHGLVTQVVSACDPGTSVTIRLLVITVAGNLLVITGSSWRT
jgi:hypothetical protein